MPLGRARVRPKHARACAVATAERVARARGAALTGTPTVETRRGLVDNGLRRTSYHPLHEDLDGVAENSELTGEACGMA
jgi:hypothetical protein